MEAATKARCHDVRAKTKVRIDVARAAVLALLANRKLGATICPSEVARMIAAETSNADWRAAMPIVHAAVDLLMDQKTIGISWKGRSLSARSGPYRIAHENDS